MGTTERKGGIRVEGRKDQGGIEKIQLGRRYEDPEISQTDLPSNEGEFSGYPLQGGKWGADNKKAREAVNYVMKEKASKMKISGGLGNHVAVEKKQPRGADSKSARKILRQRNIQSRVVK